MGNTVRVTNMRLDDDKNSEKQKQTVAKHHRGIMEGK